MIIGLDIGRNRGKAYTNGKLYSIPSFVGEYRPLKLERTMGKEDLVVEIGSRSYYVGGVAEDESLDGERNYLASKAHLDTKVIGLAMLHHMVEDGADIHVVTGHPVANHTTLERANMRQLFEGEHTLTVNGVRKQFRVKSVTVTAECAAATYLLPTKHQWAHGIDGGGATTNFVTWKSGKWIDKLSGTLPFGMDNVGLTLDRYARMVAIQFTKQIHEIRGPVYTMGGVATELAGALKLYMPNAQIIPLDEGVFANARAYYLVGVMLNENVQTQR